MKNILVLAVLIVMTAGVAAADSKPRDREPSLRDGVIAADRSPTYTALLESDEGILSTQTYSNVNGEAVVEGDIVIGTHEEVQRQSLRNLQDFARRIDPNAIGGDRKLFDQWLKQLEPIAGQNQGQTIRSLSIGVPNLWPNRTVPYTVDNGIGGAERARITQAVKIWNKLDVVTFKPALGPLPAAQILHIVPSGQPGSCTTHLVGHNAQNTTSLADDCTLYQVVHELGHVLGLRHEHSRSDRATDLAVNLSGVQSGVRSNFQIVAGGFNGTAYDPCSIMHYAAAVPGVWTTSGQDIDWFTLTTKGQKAFNTCAPSLPPSAACQTVGQRCALSPSDKAGIANLYH